MEHAWHIPSLAFHTRGTRNHACTSKMPWNMRGIRIMSATYSTQVERGVIATCVLFSNSIIAIIWPHADVDLGEIILHEPHLDSLLMLCFSHCLQKYSVYHSLFTMCVFIFSIGPSGKGGSQVTVNINHPSHSIIDNVMLYIASHFNVCTYMDVFISALISATKSGATSFDFWHTQYKN